MTVFSTTGRSLAAMLATTAFTALLAAPALAAGLVISNWDGYMAPDAMDAFKAATGVRRRGRGPCHQRGDHGQARRLGRQGLRRGLRLLALRRGPERSRPGRDRSTTPRCRTSPTSIPRPTRLKHDPGNTFSVPYTWGTTGLCYRSDLVAAAPDSVERPSRPERRPQGQGHDARDRPLAARRRSCSPRATPSTRPTRRSSPRSKDSLIAAKKTLLAYDDTTFYSKLVSGEALLVQAWDGWCNYGIAENKAIKYVIPKEGSDLWVDTMVVMKASENKDAAFQFINFMLDAKNHAWAAENILYKVPNKPAMESLAAEFSRRLTRTSAMPVADLVKFEQLRDVGEAQRDYSRIVSEIKAAQ